MSPGGLPGLQNRWRVALRAAVGSTPIHSRLVFSKIPVERETKPAMNLDAEFERIDALVGRIFYIEQRTYGKSDTNIIARYDGHLIVQDSEAAYDRLAEQLRPLGLTPLFRAENGVQSILLIPRLPQPRPSKKWVNLVLFVLTLFSVWITGGFMGINWDLSLLPSEPLAALRLLLGGGWPFAVSMLAILGAHEFGHYLAGRSHGMHVTLPYFLPLPLSPFGTIGAFIQMKEPPKNRRILLDVGIAGPLSGLIVTIPVLIIGLSLSTLDTLPIAPQPGIAVQLEGNSILYLLSKYLIFGELLPAPADYSGVSPLMYWLRYYLTGQPLPFGGIDVSLHMVAWAGWGGLLVTAVNLIPAGQLDGGHMVYVLIGRERARRLLPFILIILVGMGLLWPGWWLWALLIFFLGRTHAEPLDQITPLDPLRRGLAILGLVVFFLVFIPVPLVLMI